MKGKLMPRKERTRGKSNEKTKNRKICPRDPQGSRRLFGGINSLLLPKLGKIVFPFFVFLMFTKA